MVKINDKYEVSDDFAAFFDSSPYLKKHLSIIERCYSFEVADALIDSWVLCYMGGLVQGVRESIKKTA